MKCFSCLFFIIVTVRIPSGDGTRGYRPRRERGCCGQGQRQGQRQGRGEEAAAAAGGGQEGGAAGGDGGQHALGQLQLLRHPPPPTKPTIQESAEGK